MRYCKHILLHLRYALLAILALSLAPLCLSQTTPTTVAVTGHFGTGSNTVMSGLQLRFELQNCATGVARVFGAQTIVTTQFQLVTDSTGAVNGTIWPNDVLNCGGITGQSRWTVQQVYQNVPRSQPICYNVLAGTPLNLDNATPCPQYNPPTPPGTAHDATFGNLVVLGSILYKGQNSSGNIVGTPTASQLIQQPVGTTLAVNSFDNELDASLFPGADMGAKINAAIAYANIRYLGDVNVDNGMHLVSSGVTIRVPAKSDYSTWDYATGIVIPGLSFVPLTIKADAGAWLHYTGNGIGVDAQALTNGHNLTLDHLLLVGEPTATGGVRFGPGNGQKCLYCTIQGFTKPGSADDTTHGGFGVDFEGSDVDQVIGGLIADNWDDFLFDQARIGPAAGAYPNSNLIRDVEVGRAFHLGFNGYYVGNNNRIIDNTIEGMQPGVVAGAGIFRYFNHLIIRGNYEELATGTVKKVLFAGNSTVGSNILTVNTAVLSGTTGLAVGQPVDCYSCGAVAASSIITAINGNQVTISATALTTAYSSYEAWVTVPHAWEFHSAGTVSFTENWEANTDMHANILLDGASMYHAGNATGGAEQAQIDMTSNQVIGLQYVTMAGETYGTFAVGVNPSAFPVLKVGVWTLDPTTDESGTSAGDLNVVNIDKEARGIRLNSVAAPPKGVQVTCSPTNPTAAFTFPGGASIDCAGVYHPAAGTTPYTGSCATGKTITYTNGIATGCN